MSHLFKVPGILFAFSNVNCRYFDNAIIQKTDAYSTHSLSPSLSNSLNWDCIIHQLHICKGMIPLPKCPGYDIKQSDGKAPALELWEMWYTPSLSLFPGPH